MSIQTRLKKARYGEYNIHLPTNKEIEQYIGNISRHHKLMLGHIIPTKSYILCFQNPPMKDKYYKEHKKIVDDYIREKPTRSKSILAYDSVLRLAYFKSNPDIFYNNFEVFAPSFISHTLFSMRKYTMKQMMRDGRLPTLYNFTNPQSNGYYKLPKPMLNKSNIALANQIFNILEPSVDYWLKNRQ